MTLFERVNDRDWSDADMAWFKRHVESAAICPLSRDLILATAAAIIGHDDADLLTLRHRARELVDLAVAMQAERVTAAAVRAAQATVPPRLSVVGGRDV